MDRGESIYPEASMRQFKMCFRLWHPSMTPEAISTELGWQADWAWCVGKPRRTPKGTPLEGTYDCTYWTRKCNIPASLSLLSDVVEDFVRRMESRSLFLQRFSEGGGSAALLFVWFGRGGFTVPSAVLAKLSALEIDLSFDIYHSEDRLREPGEDLSA